MLIASNQQAGVAAMGTGDKCVLRHRESISGGAGRWYEILRCQLTRSSTSFPMPVGGCMLARLGCIDDFPMASSLDVGDLVSCKSATAAA